MTTKFEERIEALEELSLPDEIFSKLSKDLERFETFERYLEFLPTGSSVRKVAALIPDLKFQKRKSTESKDSDQKTASLLQTISHWYFLGNLVSGLNSDAQERILHAQSRLELTEQILQFKGTLRVSNLSARWTDAIDLRKFSVHLVRARRNVSWNLCKLRSSRLAYERISSKYGNGHNLLLKPLAVKVEQLHKRTEECADQYGRVLRELLSDPASSETEWPADFCEIDLDGIEQLAVSKTAVIVRRLIDVAHSEMLIALDEIPKAFEILKPYLEAEGDQDVDEWEATQKLAQGDNTNT
jgi:hypothetical protein